MSYFIIVSVIVLFVCLFVCLAALYSEITFLYFPVGLFLKCLSPGNYATASRSAGTSDTKTGSCVLTV